jgi:hypothetical protein
MAGWTFLSAHARVLLCIAHDPGARLRDIAASLDITERSAFGIITDLVEAGYVVKEKNGRRNHYHIQAHLPIPEPTGRERTVGEVLALLSGADSIARLKSGTFLPWSMFIVRSPREAVMNAQPLPGMPAGTRGRSSQPPGFP